MKTPAMHDANNYNSEKNKIRLKGFG